MSRMMIPLLAGALALAGCAAVPKLDAAPQPATAASYATARSFAAPAAAWPTDRWWAAYGDPQLDALMDEALAGSPSLAQAAARLRAHTHEVYAAGAAVELALLLGARAAHLAGQAGALDDGLEATLSPRHPRAET